MFCKILRKNLWRSSFIFGDFLEAALQRWTWEKVFWKYAANLQEDTRAEVRFQ